MKAGWEVKPLEKCIEPFKVAGKIPRKQFQSEGPYPIVSQEADYVNGYWADEANLNTITKPLVIFGDHTQVIKYIDFDFVVGADGVKVLQPKDGLDAKLFAYFLEAHPVKSLGYARHFRHMRSLPVPIPPLEEQKRIVAVLDAAFEGLTRAEENAKTNLQNARELFEAQLKEQFDPLPKMWTRKRLDEICSKIGSGATPRGGKNAYKVEGISLVRSLNIHDREFRHKGLAFIDIDQAIKLSIVTVEQDDVLLNITGASVARCAQIDNTVLPARVNQHVAIIRPIEGTIIPRFLCYELTSEPYKKALLKTGEDGGATRQAITKTQIQDLIVGYPIGKVEQNRICEKLMNAEKFSLELKAIYRTKLTDIADLRQSLLQKAFAGELT